jgi:hypothetical protein
MGRPVSVVSGGLLFSGATTLLWLVSLWMLAGEPGLKLLDLFPDLLFPVIGGKKDVVRVSALLLPLAETIVPEDRVIFFITLQHAGEFLIDFTARQLHRDFILAEIVIAEDAQLFQPLQSRQRDVETAIDEVKRVVEMDFAAQQTARVLAHESLRSFTTKDTKEEEKWVCCWR